MPNPENLSQPRKQGSPQQGSPTQVSPTQTPPGRIKQTSTERGGLGQSGYTAGREDGDVALEDTVDTRHVGKPGSATDGLGTDDRFTGRGGPVSDVERDGPDSASTEADGASGRDDDDTDEGTDRSGRSD